MCFIKLKYYKYQRPALCLVAVLKKKEMPDGISTGALGTHLET
jgi:hypothetical protein